MHAILDFVRENEEEVLAIPEQCQAVLVAASKHLMVLDPEHGEQVLFQAVAIELAKLL